MESYRTEEEQVEALRKWWDENGRSTILAVIIALGGAFGWRAWQDHNATQREDASDLYQSMLQVAAAPELTAQRRSEAEGFANRLKSDYAGSTYAQFAALQLARGAVEAGDLATAEAELRWVLGKADRGSDVARVAELRLARVLAAKGEAEQALAVLAQADEGTYGSAYAVARGDILLGLGRDEEARQAYTSARAMGAGEASRLGQGTLQQKLQSLNPVPARELAVAESADAQSAAALPETEPTPAAAEQVTEQAVEQAADAAAEE